MKKRLVSLVAAAALLGSVSIASAGTVTTKGDTNISISGFVAEYLGFANNQSGLFSTAASNPAMKNGGGTNGAQTNFSSTANVTRLRLNLDNKVEGITGEISGDFRSGTGNYNDGGTSTFRLRQAWFMKSFCQEGCNYTPWLLIGQTNSLGMPGTYSFLGLPIGGVAGSAATNPTRVPQVAFGVKFDLGSVKLNPEIAVMDLQQFANNYGGFLNGKSWSGTGWSDTPPLSSLSNNYGITGMRTSYPGLGIKVPLEFNTGLGAPATFYVDAQMQTMKVNYANGGSNSFNNNKTSWMVGGGLELPIYFVTLKGDLAYLRGFSNMSYIFGDTYGSSQSPATPPSYWVNGNGSLEQTHATQWDVEAKVDFNKLAQVPFTVAGGYSQVVFSHLPMGGNNNTWLNSYNTKAPGMAAAPVRKASTIFANVSYNMTKSTTLGLEWDRNNTNYVVDPGTTYHSDAVYLVGIYNF